MDKKKLISILSGICPIVIALAMFFISHHHIDTARKMHERLTAGITEMTRLTSGISEAGRKGGKPQMLAYVRDNKPKAAEAANTVREVCDYYEKLKVPSALKDKHSAVREAIPQMRYFVNLFEGMFKEVMLESEFEAAVSAAAAGAESLAENDGFILSEQAFFSEMERIERQRKSGLVWL